MQTKAITGIAASPHVLDETALGFNPAKYTRFAVRAADLAGDTWGLEVLFSGDDTYTAYGAAALGEDASRLVAEDCPPISSMRIVYTGGGIAAGTAYVVAWTRDADVVI